MSVCAKIEMSRGMAMMFFNTIGKDINSVFAIHGTLRSVHSSRRGTNKASATPAEAPPPALFTASPPSIALDFANNRRLHFPSPVARFTTEDPARVACATRYRRVVSVLTSRGTPTILVALPRTGPPRGSTSRSLPALHLPRPCSPSHLRSLAAATVEDQDEAVAAPRRRTGHVLSVRGHIGRL